jgi:hypothetical protein
VNVTAQPEADGFPVLLDLRPPVRAESIDLRALVSHRTATQASASVESVAEIFKTESANFVAVLDDQRLVGMCSRQEISALLGGRYGFSLFARKPIGQHLCQQETRIKVAMPIGDVLRAVFARPDENFYDDVLLVDENGGFVGFIATETLFKVQNALLLTNIRDLEERDHEIRQKNEQMETDLRMATELQQAADAKRVSEYSGRHRHGGNEVALLSPLPARDPDGRRFFSHRTAWRRYGCYLHLRCDGLRRPRSADHGDDARNDRNPRS